MDCSFCSIRPFYERNFTNQGLCHILRGLLFEAPEIARRYRVSDAQRAYLHHLTAVCNRVGVLLLRLNGKLLGLGVPA